MMILIRQSLVKRINWDRPAVITDEGRFTYRDIAQRAGAIARLLPRNGKRNIAILLPNGEGFIAALYGTFMAGMAAFPLSTRLTAHEIAPLLALATVPVVLTSSAYREVIDAITKLVPVQAVYIDRMQKGVGDEYPTAEVGVDEQMILLATSGTTGNMKIVRLSERNVAASTCAYIDKMSFESDAAEGIRFALGTPYSSVYGLMVLTACIIKSFPIVVLREPFTMDALYDAAARHRVTHFEGGVSVGILMEQMAGRPVRYDISSFRYFGLAGSKISSGTLRRLHEAYPGVAFWPGYGMTEAGPLIAKPDKHVNMEKLDSVGTKIDCVTIMIEANGSLTDEPYATGEIAVKGPNVMLGYLNNEQETEKTIRNGYLYTGDIGYLDADGYLYINGRSKNVILVRGFTVHAEEVEAAIIASGLAKDCIVYGETEPSGNERICADVIAMADGIEAEQIHAYCRAHMADFKQPKRVRMIQAIKKTETGKTERA